MSLLFYPRGGSSQVVRYLVPALEESGWPVSLVAGSLGKRGDRTHAESFFKHPRLTTVDYGPALEAHAQGRDPMAVPVPMHPSFEDRPGAPDPVLAAVPPATGDLLVALWERVFEKPGRTARASPTCTTSPNAGGGHAALPRRPDREPSARHRDPVARSHRPAARVGRDPRDRPRRNGRVGRPRDPIPPTSTRRSGGCCRRPAGSSGASGTTGPAGCGMPRARRAASSRSPRTCATRRAGCSTCRPRSSRRSRTGSTWSASTGSCSARSTGWRGGGGGWSRSPWAGTSPGEPGSIRYREDDLRWFHAD